MSDDEFDLFLKVHQNHSLNFFFKNAQKSCVMTQGKQKIS